MKVIDAHSGDEIKVGYTAPPWRTHELDGSVSVDRSGQYTVLSIEPGFFSASMTVRMLADGSTKKLPLMVRWLHPGFLLQHVAFVPS